MLTELFVQKSTTSGAGLVLAKEKRRSAPRKLIETDKTSIVNSQPH
jgi:hypothetical protein